MNEWEVEVGRREGDDADVYLWNTFFLIVIFLHNFRRELLLLLLL